jgi:hypothetical protein
MFTECSSLALQNYRLLLTRYSMLLTSLRCVAPPLHRAAPSASTNLHFPDKLKAIDMLGTLYRVAFHMLPGLTD